MAAAPRDDNPFDGRFADAASLAFTPVNPVLELKKSFLAIGIYVVGNTRSAQFYGLR